MFKQTVLTVCCIAAILGWSLTAVNAGMVTGNGLAGGKDAKIIGVKAAMEAKFELGDVKPKIVVVFAGRQQLNSELVEGVAAVFDKDIIYGCEGYSPITEQGNLPDKSNADGAAVLAIGGDVDVSVASADTRDKSPVDGLDNNVGYYNCGKKIGEKLKAEAHSGNGGKLLFTFGDQHVGNNQAYVDGLQSVLGEDFAIIGAAAGSSGSREIVAGEIVKATNVGVLLRGDFKLGLCTRKDSSREGLVNSAREAFTGALKNAEGNAKFLFVFDCGGRRGSLHGNGDLTNEFKAMKSVAGDLPMFGFYGGGEIGHADVGEPARGVGNSISACAVIEK